MRKKLLKLSLVLIITLFFTSAITIAKEPPDDEVIDRARKTVKLLDDLYKTFIELITEEYVNNPALLSAATLSKRVFKVMEEKGWHKARLLDATGTPFNPDNNPRDQFERNAINAFVWGNAYIERVEEIEGIYYLRAATSVTAVTEGCTICHPGKKVGDLLGAISYTIPLQE